MPNFCTKCGAKVDPNDAFCPQCGNPLKMAAQAQPAQPQAPVITPGYSSRVNDPEILAAMKKEFYVIRDFLL